MSFWANKLNGQQNSQPVAPPSRDMYAMYNPVLPQEMQQPQYQAPQQSQAYTPSVKTTQGSICPGCGSDRYMLHPPGQPDRTLTCPDCGFNPRFQQTGYGVPSLAIEKGATVQAARQTGDHQTMQAAIRGLNSGRQMPIEYQ